MSSNSGSTPQHASISSQQQPPKLQLPLTCDPPNEDNPPQQATWIIFGATGHMGRSLARMALTRGDKATVVGHDLENTIEQMQGWHESRSLGLLCDVRIRETVEKVIQTSIAHWGRVDVIAKDADAVAQGVVAAAEDQSAHDLSNQFATNFMGTLHILQLSLPYFRENGIPGRYLIFSSTAGALGVPGMSGYCATKYAVEGLVESLLYEVHCFGIKATLVEPGHVKDDDEKGYIVSKSQEEEAAMARESNKSKERKGKKKQQQTVGRSLTGDSSNLPSFSSASESQHRFTSDPSPAHPPPPTTTTTTTTTTHDTPEAPHSPSTSPPPIRQYSHFLIHPHPSPAYKAPTHPSGHAQRVFTWLGRRQPTSAVRSAELVWQLGHCAYPPLRLLLGEYAVESVRDRLKCVTEEIEDWKFLSFACAGDGGGSGGQRGGSGGAGRSGGRFGGSQADERGARGESRDWEREQEEDEDEDEEMEDGEGQEDIRGESDESDESGDDDEEEEDAEADADAGVEELDTKMVEA
ncbi:MAG: hypothetical protein M1831_001949 [Alyxoria varia]|nr:MAG: hypothetical protein M1831_001949 [Alyxoria varia]